MPGVGRDTSRSARSVLGHRMVTTSTPARPFSAGVRKRPARLEDVVALEDEEIADRGEIDAQDGDEHAADAAGLARIDSAAARPALNRAP